MLDELNAFFASDPLIVKVRDLAARLRELKDTVKADDLDARLKAARDQAARSLRDRTELFEGDGTVIRLGRHRFNVNTQPLDLTLLPRGDDLAVHLTGTEYLDPLDHPALNDLRAYWSATLVSESAELSRAEYLAGEVLRAAQDGQEGLTLAGLHALSPDDLSRTVAAFAAPATARATRKAFTTTTPRGCCRRCSRCCRRRAPWSTRLPPAPWPPPTGPNTRRGARTGTWPLATPTPCTRCLAAARRWTRRWAPWPPRWPRS
ncbi:hypothetical protein [Deinococcus multiflagellatus]|uniref:DNA helicase n=1 Tax=Deinococcus multiflagellatus TaxID=1656887 RepID=A0ABW1ZMU0_9DEIO